MNIRMDDTNPTKEEKEYVESIMADVHWLIDDGRTRTSAALRSTLRIISRSTMNSRSN